MSYQPWNEQEQGDYQHEQEARESAAHLKLVHNAALGGEEASDADIQRLAIDFADTTDACNYILARYAATSKKFYDPSKRVRDFLCAVIGATGGRPDYVEVTDDDLAARMGCSPKTLQTARNEFRSWPDHAKLVGIKDNYREPLEQGGKSHPHAYLCRLTLMSAAATADNRLGVEMREAARIEADSVAGFQNRPAKRRRKATDSEMVVREAEQAANTLMRAAARQNLARNVDFERLAQAWQRIVEALAALDEAYGFHAEISIQKKEEEQSETLGGEQPDESGFEPRMEASDDPAVVEVESTQVEKFSTHNDLTESTTYDFGESDAGPPFDLSEWVWVGLDGEPDYKLPPPGRFSSEADDLITQEFERLRSASKGVSHATS
ncbi:MAG: hypothetical protein QOJ70_1128 [Acidobacteriota bacterium]|jgi:hypothetical protein|nr:hypothetical protein [Acidobacteriota bacterium]